METNTDYTRPGMTSALHMRAAGTADAGVVLVIGGAGYIGSMLVRKLLERKRKVRVLDNLLYGNAGIAELVSHPELEIVKADCRNPSVINTALQGADAVVHLAAIVGDAACRDNPRDSLEINYSATRMIAEAARVHRVKRFLFASSCSVYGISDGIVDERSVTNPISLYAETKINSENAILALSNRNFCPTVLRLATVFGYSYRPRFDLAVNVLTAKACKENTITIFNGDSWRPFIHVTDVAEGFARMLEVPCDVVAKEIFNLGDSHFNFRLDQVGNAIASVVPDVRCEDTQGSDRRSYRVSFQKIRLAVGFRCRIGLREGITEIRDALKMNSLLDYKDPQYDNHRFLQTPGALRPYMLEARAS